MGTLTWNNRINEGHPLLHRLDKPGLLDPRVFNVIRAGRARPVVIDACTVEVEGERFALASPDEVTLTPGQTVYVTLNRWFFLETSEERQARECQAREAYQRQQEERRENERRYCEEADAFNSQYRLPAAWIPGSKDVLSGLSENSAGNGWNARTVVHMMLQEDLRHPRLSRRSGDFLCTSARGSNGKQWSAQPEEVWHDGEGNTVRAKVTCQRCLKLAERWKVEAAQ